MNLLTLLSGEQLGAVATTIVMQVTFVLTVTCAIACLIRRNAAARHAVCLAGLLLAVACPVLAVNGGTVGWTWLRVDWPTERVERLEPERSESLVVDQPEMAAIPAAGEASWTTPEPERSMTALESDSVSAAPITIPPDALYRPGGEMPADESGDAAPLAKVAPDPERTPSTLAVSQSPDDPAVSTSPAESNAQLTAFLRGTVRYGLPIWLLGVFVQIARWLIAHRRLKTMLRDLTELDSSRFGELISRVTTVTELPATPRVLTGPLVPVPLVYGVLRPRVLLPQHFADGVDSEALRDVLIHECAHVSRRDAWISLLQRVSALLYWPHPLLHLLNRQLVSAREELCDNYVLREGQAASFAETLLRLSERLAGHGVPVGLLSLLAKRHRLESRVVGLLDEDRSVGTRPGRLAIVVVAAAACAVVVGAIGIRAVGDVPETESDAGESAITDSEPSVEFESDHPDAEPDADAVSDGEDDSAQQDAVESHTSILERADLGAVIDALAEHCSPWVNAPNDQLRSLQYTYTLGNDERRVELVSGVSDVRRGMWYGSTLGTGLHWLLRHPERFDVTLALLESELDRLQLTIRSKPTDERIHLEIGNGISGSWRGYFTHGSDEMTLIVDAERMLPVSETHKLGNNPAITTIHYRDWEEIGDDRWIPKLVDVEHDEAVYHMHFAWQGEAAWLLTHAETEYQGSTSATARVSNFVVNDEELIRRSMEEQRQRESAAGIVRTMLEHNQPWLAGDLSGLDSLSYTFHTLREDVKEQCVVGDDGTVVMQVTHDGQDKMGERLGERQVALPSGEWARAQREDRFALINAPSEEDRGQSFAAELQHYARIGSQLDLPLFQYDELLTGANVEIEEGEWNGTPCHMATVRSLGRDVYLGCGTMLGFTSWSYVHHIRPAYETIYIDSERNVPLHETLISSRDNKRFEIDFGDYREIEPGQWAPLSIRVESPGYFTCELKFQLIEGRHWLLSEVDSWFDAENRSRGVVEDVVVGQPSELLDAALEQIEATREVFGGVDDGVSQTIEIPVHPFVLGNRIDVGEMDVVFTIGPRGDLVAHCFTDDDELGPVSILLLDANRNVLSVGGSSHTPSPGDSDGLQAQVSLGHSTGLSSTSSFAAFIGGEAVENETAAVRVDAVGTGAPIPIKVPDQLEGKTRAVSIELNGTEEDGQVALVGLASQDTGLGFRIDVSVCVFDELGQLVSSGMQQGSLVVRGQVSEEKLTVALSPFDPASAAHVLVGVNRGSVTHVTHGSRWMMLMDDAPIFDIGDLLAGETPETWWSGISQLGERLSDDSMREEFLHQPDRLRSIGENRVRRRETLKPHVQRLVEIVTRTRTQEPTFDEQDARLVATATRMIGLAGDHDHAEILLPMLESPAPSVRDSAAVALGLLGRSEGLDRLQAMLAMPREELMESQYATSDGRLIIRRWGPADEILMALLGIDTEAAAAVVGEQMLRDLELLETRVEDGETQIVSGDPQRLFQMWRLLGVMQQANAIDYLTRSMSWIDERADVAQAMELQPLIISLLDYAEQTQDLLAERIRRGDYDTIRVLKESRNAHFIPAAREMMLNEETEAWTFYQGVSYLWNVGTDDAKVVMAELHEQGLPSDQRTRLRLCEALAYHGDDRGLTEAFEVLVKACAPEVPPEDAGELRAWQRARDNAREDPVAVFERAETASRIAVAREHLDTVDVATQVACLAILETLRGAMPESVRESLEEWSDSENAEVAASATRLMQREE